MATQTGSSSEQGDARTHSDDRKSGSRGKRVATAAAGGTLLALGLRRGSRAGKALAAVGGWLLYRGVRGGGRSTGGERTAGESEESEGTAEESEESAGTAEESEAIPGVEPRREGPTAVERSITVDESPDELYRYWRDSDLLTRIVGDFAEVDMAGPDSHRWRVPTPVGLPIEWETEMVEDRPGEFLRWRATDDATVPFEGSVSFRPAPADRGTEVTLTLSVDPPGGRVGDAAMELLGVVPETLAGTALDRLKSLAETGEIPTTEGNPSGRGSGDLV